MSISPAWADMLTIVSIKHRVFTVKELGESIKGARRELKLNQIELAQRANVARGAVQKLEEGRGTVNLDTVFKLLRTLSLDLTVESRTSATSSLSEDGERGV
jgi:HTH-type transcriptional regulator / antitoxin HipB